MGCVGFGDVSISFKQLQLMSSNAWRGVSCCQQQVISGWKLTLCRFAPGASGRCTGDRGELCVQDFLGQPALHQSCPAQLAVIACFQCNLWHFASHWEGVAPGLVNAWNVESRDPGGFPPKLPTGPRKRWASCWQMGTSTWRGRRAPRQWWSRVRRSPKIRPSILTSHGPLWVELNSLFFSCKKFFFVGKAWSIN